MTGTRCGSPAKAAPTAFDCPLPPGDAGDDLMERVFSRLRSFPHPAGWIESLGCGRYNGRFEAVWYCPPTLTGPELTEVVTARLTMLGLTAENVTWTPWTDDDQPTPSRGEP